MEWDEVVYVTTSKVACDGNGGALGHPRIFLKFGEQREISCPYCSRKFILSEDAQPADQH
jgi:uncharacterized Zn-finger protein